MKYGNTFNTKESNLGAKGIIINEQGDALVLVKQNGKVDFAGGKVNSNESFQSCLHREIYEETRIRTQIHYPILYWSFLKTPRRLIQGCTFICTPLSLDIVLSDEHKEYFWIKARDLNHLNFYPSYGLETFNKLLLHRQIVITGPASAPVKLI